MRIQIICGYYGSGCARIAAGAESPWRFANRCWLTLFAATLGLTRLLCGDIACNTADMLCSRLPCR